MRTQADINAAKAGLKKKAGDPESKDAKKPCKKSEKKEEKKEEKKDDKKDTEVMNGGGGKLGMPWDMFRE